MRPLHQIIRLTLLLTVFLGVAAWLSPPQAHAYILPARYYLSRCIKAQAKIPALSIRQTTITFRNGKRHRTYREVLRIQRPGTIRLDRYYKGKKVRIDLWKGQFHWVWKQGQSTTKSARQLTPKYDFLALNTGSVRYGNLKSMLSVYGIRYKGKKLWRRRTDYYIQKRLSLTWMKTAPQIVVGAPSGDRTSNQLWINKYDYSISRFLGRLGSPLTSVDVRFFDYHKAFQGKLFPGRIEEWIQGKRLSLTLVSSVKALRQFSPGVLTRLP